MIMHYCAYNYIHVRGAQFPACQRTWSGIAFSGGLGHLGISHLRAPGARPERREEEPNVVHLPVIAVVAVVAAVAELAKKVTDDSYDAGKQYVRGQN